MPVHPTHTLPCSANMAAHDPIAYRPLLLRLAQSGTGVLPMGALRLLAAYARCAAGAGWAGGVSAEHCGRNELV